MIAAYISSTTAQTLTISLVGRLLMAGDPDFVNVTQVELDILKNNYVATLRETVMENDVLGLTEYGGSDYGVKEEDLNNLKGYVIT
jgi:hypothetical protein